MGFGHGKLILLGEHGVVYGRPAIAAALPGGAEAFATPAERPRLEVETWGVAFDADQKQADAQTELLRQAFCALLDLYVTSHGPRPALCVKARLSLPAGAGLGGSAALSVAIVRAIDAALGVERNATEVAEASLAAERVFHGNPSGIDSALAAHGGVALYRRDRPLERLKLGRRLTLVVGHSGESHIAHEMIGSVARQNERNPKKLGQIFDGMEAIVMNGKSALATGELSRLGQLMVLNQKLLNTLLLSTVRLEEMCQAAEQAGALGAKLTGSGGGGCMIALCEGPAQAQNVKAALVALGRDAFIAEVGA
jgi:mevalonate kinase